MAVRSAYSLGLHREETLVIFSQAEQHVRRQVWRSLYVMDRFLSVSLGRPPAIHEEDCSGDALNPPPTSPNPTPTDVKFYFSGLEAGVRGCHILGTIIRDVYSKRKVSTKTAQEIADRCKIWPKTLPPALHWRQASPSNPRQAILILHVNMIYCHAIILFTRPFFLFLLSSELQRKYLGSNQCPRPRHGKTEKFSEACVIASLHTIALIQNACSGGYLPMQNPFIIYCLFSAALVVLSGKLAAHSSHEASPQAIENAISILAYCGKLDPQAARMVDIFKSFREIVVKEERKSQSPEEQTNLTLQLPSATPGSFPQQISPFIQQMTDPNPSSQLQGALPDDLPPEHQPIDPAIAPSFSLPASNSSFEHTAKHNMAQEQGPPRLSTMRTDSFSGLLDLENTDKVLGASSSDGEGSGLDNEIDFATLWSWPGNELVNPNGALGGFNNHGVVGEGRGLGLKDLGVQGISDSQVPLFGTSMDAQADEA